MILYDDAESVYKVIFLSIKAAFSTIYQSFQPMRLDASDGVFENCPVSSTPFPRGPSYSKDRGSCPHSNFIKSAVLICSSLSIVSKIALDVSLS